MKRMFVIVALLAAWPIAAGAQTPRTPPVPPAPQIPPVPPIPPTPRVLLPDLDMTINDAMRQARESLANIDMNQIHNALDIAQRVHLDLPDMRLDTLPHVEINAVVEQHVRDFAAECVYTPHPDVNRDHRALFDSVAVATRPAPGQTVTRLYTYAPTSSTEWTPAALNWFVPNWFVEITGTIERKVAAFAHYETERRDYPHPRSERAIRAAAEFYGASCGCEHAEPFVLVRGLESV